MGKSSSTKRTAKIIVTTGDTEQPKIEGVSRRKRLIYALTALTILLIACVIGYFVYNISNSKNEFDPRNAKQIIKMVSEHYVVPEGETPTTAIVKNEESFRNIGLFTKVKKDDWVLIYRQANTIILYRPSIDKIVKVIYVDPDTNNKQ